MMTPLSSKPTASANLGAEFLSLDHELRIRKKVITRNFAL
jgi:hypothetical protein